MWSDSGSESGSGSGSRTRSPSPSRSQRVQDVQRLHTLRQALSRHRAQYLVEFGKSPSRVELASGGASREYREYKRRKAVMKGACRCTRGGGR